MQKIIHNEDDMATLAARLAPRLKTGDVVTLQGDLGAGKTVFARALINALSPEPQEVPSPTFTLVQTYDLPPFTLWHFDFYRLEEEKNDILELGWDEARRSGIALVEWPERLGRILPKDRLEIRIQLDSGSENKRIVTLAPFGGLVARMKGFE